MATDPERGAQSHLALSEAEQERLDKSRRAIAAYARSWRCQVDVLVEIYKGGSAVLIFLVCPLVALVAILDQPIAPFTFPFLLLIVWAVVILYEISLSHDVQERYRRSLLIAVAGCALPYAIGGPKWGALMIWILAAPVPVGLVVRLLSCVRGGE